MELLASKAIILALFLGLLASARPKHQAIAMETIACSHVHRKHSAEAWPLFEKSKALYLTDMTMSKPKSPLLACFIRVRGLLVAKTWIREPVIVVGLTHRRVLI